MANMMVGCLVTAVMCLTTLSAGNVVVTYSFNVEHAVTISIIEVVTLCHKRKTIATTDE